MEKEEKKHWCRDEDDERETSTQTRPVITIRRNHISDDSDSGRSNGRKLRSKIGI